MENKHLIKLPILAITVVLLALLAAADSHCRMSEKGLLACLQSISGSTASATTLPSADCCKALAKADLPCLCAYKNSPALRQLGIKPDLAVQLPTKCKLPVPKQCM